MRTRRVLFVTMDASQTGGIERSLSNLLPHIDHDGTWRVSLASCFGAPERARFDYGSVPVTYLTNGASDFITGSRLRKLRDYLRLAVAIMRLPLRGVDRIVSVYPVITLLLLLFHPHLRSRIRAWEHSQPDAHSGLLNRLRRRWYAKLGGVIVLTDRQRRAFEGHADRIRVIPNALKPLDVVHQPRRDEPWHIVGVGRLSPEKGFDRLIEVLAELGSTRSDWRATIFGDGPERSSLAKLIDERGMTGRIAIRGGVQDPQEIYGRADITAVCSRSEVFGMVIVESMSIGAPVIAYDGGEGPRDLISSGSNGLLVPDGDLAAFRDGLVQLMEDGDLYDRIRQSGMGTADSYSVSLLSATWREELSRD